MVNKETHYLSWKHSTKYWVGLAQVLLIFNYSHKFLSLKFLIEKFIFCDSDTLQPLNPLFIWISYIYRMFNTMLYEIEPDGPFLYKLGPWKIWILFGETPEYSLQHICTSPLCAWDGAGDTQTAVRPCLLALCTQWPPPSSAVPALPKLVTEIKTSGPEECWTELLLMSLKTQLGRKLGMEQLTKIKLRALWLILN